jgi:hypothetical protein
VFLALTARAGKCRGILLFHGTSHVELTPGVVIVVAVVAVAVSFVLIRWGRRHEAPAPVDVPAAPARSSMEAAREERDRDPLVNWLLDRAFEQTGVRVSEDPLARERIAQAAVKAMEELGTGGSATVSLPFLTADAQGPKHFNLRLKRNPDSTFETQR